MKQPAKIRKGILPAIFFLILTFFVSSAFAADPFVSPSTMPSSARPETISNAITARDQATADRPLPVTPAPQEQQSSPLGAQAEKIKFKLANIKIEGNHVYTDEQLSMLYRDKINKTISVAQLAQIVQDITNFYRNNGYILSRAVLPPQHVAGGVVQVRVLEGYIDQIKIEGTPKGAKSIVYRYVHNVMKSRPLKISVLEYYLRLANQVPGANVRAVFEPSKANVAASTLSLVTDQQTFTGFISYDNYGTLYSGPNQVSSSGAVNSIFRSGDSTRLFYVTTSRPLQLRYWDLTYLTPIYSRGLQLSLEGNQSKTQPGLNLAALKTEGQSNNYMAFLNYPLILNRATDLTLNGGFTYINTGVTIFRQKLYLDHIRTLKFGANFNHADTWKGTNNVQAFAEQGLNILGATNNPNSTTISRLGGEAVFTKLNAQVSRTQFLGQRISAFILAKGQYSFNPLLSANQFAFGGSQLGRGYDPADIIGDLGAGGSLELRSNFTPGLALLQFFQPYIFYDAGAIWNRRKIVGSNTKQSETSAGGGIRFYFTKNLSGNLMMGQPLTKQDTAEQVRGNGRKPRGFFSITLSI
jgi:hemolysin activation/secretion protein